MQVSAKLVEGIPMSSAVPIVQGMIVGERESEIDAVPLIDQQTASVLSRVSAFTIVQRPSITETLCAPLERSNIYDVYDGTSGQHLFFAKERSECLPRCCCAPRHSLFIDFKLSIGVPPQMLFLTDIDTLPIALTMEREGCFSKPGLGCCACCAMCKDGMYLHAGPVHTTAGSLKAASPQCVGFASQPHMGGYMTPTINIMERARGGGSAENAWNTLAKVEGPTCFGGCAELCCNSTFKVSSMGLRQIDQKVAMCAAASAPCPLLPWCMQSTWGSPVPIMQ
jgi:hypothetical protein